MSDEGGCPGARSTQWLAKTRCLKGAQHENPIRRTLMAMVNVQVAIHWWDLNAVLHRSFNTLRIILAIKISFWDRFKLIMQPKWLWTFDFTVSSSTVLWLQVYSTVPSLCGAGSWTQGFEHTKQALYQWSYIFSPWFWLFLGCLSVCFCFKVGFHFVVKVDLQLSR